MELTEHSCKRCGGALKPDGENRWKCPYCGMIYDEDAVVKSTKTMSELFDAKELETVNNLRRNLYDAVNAEYISSSDVKAAAAALKKRLPDDFAACFYEVACGNNLKATVQQIRKIDVEKNRDEIESVIKFLIKSLQPDFLLELNNLVERAYKNTDLEAFEKYATMISDEAEKVQMGVYETKLPREVFIAYSSKDMDKVSILCEVLESQGLQCFVAARNLRHGKGSVENYDKALKEAMDHCKSFVFVSSMNSRQFSCDALGIEIPYIESIDRDNSPAEYRNSYTAIPHKYKKPRVEYRVEESRGFNAADSITNEFFDGYERVYSPEEVAKRILKQLVEVPVASESTGERVEPKPEPKKICVSCGAENPRSASFCTRCRATSFVSTSEEYLRIKNQRELEQRRREEEARRAAAAAQAKKPADPPKKKKKKKGFIVPLIIVGVIILIVIIVAASRNNVEPPYGETNNPAETMRPSYSENENMWGGDYVTDPIPDDGYGNGDDYGDIPVDTVPPYDDDVGGATEPPYGDDVDGSTEPEGDGEIQVLYEGTGGNLAYTITSDGVLTLTGCAAMADFEYSGAASWNVFIDSCGEYANYFVKKIVIGDDVLSVGNYAFSYFSEVTEVEIRGDGVTKIGTGAFHDCSALESINLDTVEVIGDSAFSGCTSLKSVKLPAINTISTYAFNGCLSLNEVDIGDGIAKVGEHAFLDTAIFKEQNDQGLPVVVDNCLLTSGSASGVLDTSAYPDVVLIADKAFYYATAIEGVVLSEGIATIGEYAFADCNSMLTLSLPATLKNVGTYAFSSCDLLATVSFADGATLEYIPEGMFANCDLLSSITIPSFVKTIGDDAFNSCHALGSITVPASVESIGVNAFYECYAFTTLTFESGSQLSSIGTGAFRGCTELVSVSFPDGMMLGEIGDEAFKNCYKLYEIRIPASVTKINKYAFSGNQKLSNVIVPDSVTDIGEYAFEDCYELEAITYLGSTDEWEAVNKESEWGPNMGTYTSNNTTVIVCLDGDLGSDALEYYTEGLTFGINSDGTGYRVKGYTGTAAQVTIPSVYNGLPVIEIGTRAFYDNLTVTDVIIPASVVSIKDYAFYNADNLTNVTIAQESALSSIGKEAFYSCSGLTVFNIPKNVTSMDQYVFAHCTSLITVNFEDGCVIEELPQFAFYECEALTNIVLPDSVKRICGSAFYRTAITFIPLSDNSTLDFIGENAFGYCTYLKSVKLPATVTSIESYAFSNSSAIEYSETTVAQFNYVPKTALKTVVFINAIPTEGDETTGQSLTTSSIRENSTIETVVLSDDIVKIGTNVFYKCSALKSITFGSGIVEIGEQAFLNCSALETITIPATVTTIGNSAFAGCDALTSVTIQGNVEGFGSYVFDGCDLLASVTLAEGVTNIGAYTFRDCKALTSITFPVSLITISERAFYRAGLTSVTLPAGVEVLGAYAFDGCSAMSELKIEGNPDQVGNYCFSDCVNITEAEIPAKMIQYLPKDNLATVVITEGDIPAGAFASALKLRRVTLPTETEELIIQENAFSGCVSLMSITLPENLGGIGDKAFYGCYKLVEIVNHSSKVIAVGDGSKNGYVAESALVVHDGESVIDDSGDYVFITVEGEHYLVGYFGNETAITLPESYNGEVYRTRAGTFANDNSITSVTLNNVDIASKFFYKCSALQSVTIGSGVASIGEYAFAECSALETVTIADDVTEICRYAFYKCTQLKSLSLGTGVESIREYAFANCSALAKITLPASVTAIERYAFSSCSSLIGVTFADQSHSWELRSNKEDASARYTLEVDDSSTNATNLRSNYYSYWWTRAAAAE